MVMHIAFLHDVESSFDVVYQHPDGGVQHCYYASVAISVSDAVCNRHNYTTWSDNILVCSECKQQFHRKD